MIAEWQKTHGWPDTGYLTGPQYQELVKAGAAAIAKFDDDQKKAAAATTTQSPQSAAVSPGPPRQVSPPVVAGSPDGVWTGTYQCGANKVGSPFTMPVRMTVQGGRGVHTINIASPAQPGNHSLAVTITGATAVFQRTFVAGNGKNAGTQITTSLNARFEGGTITGTGEESQGNRTCTVSLTR